jgi:branched-chain amino acid transport system permease protein
VVIAVFLALAILLPSGPVAKIMAPQSGWPNVLSEEIGIYVLMAIGLNVVVGQAGMLDLGYVAFFAVGGYTLGLLATRRHWDFWIILPLGIAAAAAAGLTLGAPTLRLRGDYLAIVTLGFGLIIFQAATNFSFDGGSQGISVIPHPPSIDHIKSLSYGVINFKPYWYLVLAVIFVAIGVVRRLERSRVGRAWIAIREDEDVAELMGVPTYRFRLWAFAIGAAIGGAGGVLFASEANHIEPGNFSYEVSILVVAAVVLGGSGNLYGVILGGFMVAWLPERFRGFAEYRILIFGVALVVMMIFRPQGLLPSKRRAAELSEPSAGGGMGAAMVAPDLEGDA